MSNRKSPGGKAGGKARSIPWAGVLLVYYALAVTAFRYLLHDYLHNVLDRQVIGPKDTLLVTLFLSLYMLACDLPPFFWSRNSFRHPLWRGMESFSCYVVAALAAGGLLAVLNGNGWTPFSGLGAGEEGWTAFAFLALLLALFLAASWVGSRVPPRRKRAKRRKA